MSPPHAENPDMLAAIFSMQSDLNDRIFESNEIRDQEGMPLRMSTIIEQVRAGKLMVNDLPNQWLSRYSVAMRGELDELREDLRWKWWSKDAIDLQNIRVELIDILHFLVSAMLAAGLTPERVFEIYRQKHSVNIARQDAGYSEAGKSEADNRSIT